MCVCTCENFFEFVSDSCLYNCCVSRQISLDDRLPKMICDSCCKKLDGIHKFATMAVKIQDKFNKIATHDLDKTVEPKKIEAKGLLHTYLTKVCNNHFCFVNLIKKRLNQ